MRRGGPLCSSGALTWSDSSPPPTLSNGAPRPPRTEPQGPTEGQRRAAGSAPSLLGVFHWTDRAQLVNPFLGGFTGGHFPLLHGRVLLCLAFRHPESRVPAPSHPHPPRFPATVPAEQPHPREACFSSLRETRRNRAQESGDKLEGGPGGILSCPCQAAPDRCAQRLVEAQSCSSETPRSPHMASRGVPRSLRARGWCGLGSRDGKTEGVLGRPPVTGTGPSWEACGICLRNAIGV